MLFKPKPREKISIFYCYARKDKKPRDTLADHLSNLRWQGLITEWHDFDISPGQEWEHEIAAHLDTADIILLLITRNFMASYYCHEVEMKRAIERHKAKAARVIPILLGHVDWENAPFSKLQVLPSNAKPVSGWTDKDKAYVDICHGIKKVVNEFLGYTEKSQTRQTGPKLAAHTGRGTFAAEGYSTVATRQTKRLPPLRYQPSVGEKIQNVLRNFSFQEFKHRSRNYLVALLFTFGVLDLVVLPYFIYKWSTSPGVGIIGIIFIFILFIMGISSKHSAIGGIVAFIFFLVWTAVGIIYLPVYYHLSWSPATIFLTIFIVSLFRLELLRKH